MKFIIYQDKAKKWRWRLKARNGRIVADSGQGYSRKESMLKTIYSIRWCIYHDVLCRGAKSQHTSAGGTYDTGKVVWGRLK